MVKDGAGESWSRLWERVWPPQGLCWGPSGKAPLGWRSPDPLGDLRARGHPKHQDPGMLRLLRSLGLETPRGASLDRSLLLRLVSVAPRAGAEAD